MLDKKLLRYSSMAAGILGLQESASAQSIYYDIDPDFVLSNAPDSLLMDVNMDGTDDFQFFVNAGTYTGTYSSMPYTMYYTTAGVTPMNGAGVLGTVGTYDNYAKALNCNDNFYSSSNFVTQPTVFGSVIQFNVPGYGTYGPYSFGNFLNSNSAYFGFKYLENSNVKLGWMRISVNADGTQLTLHDEEYNFTGQCSVICTAVEEHPKNDFSFTVDADFLTVNFGNSNPESLSICDLKGSSLISRSIHSSLKRVDISGLPAGVYFISVTEGSLVKTAKFFKY